MTSQYRHILSQVLREDAQLSRRVVFSHRLIVLIGEKAVLWCAQLVWIPLRID